jgi:hypothetical protein
VSIGLVVWCVFLIDVVDTLASLVGFVADYLLVDAENFPSGLLFLQQIASQNLYECC